MLIRYVRMTLVTLGILVIGSGMVLGCSKSSDNKGTSENVPVVTPVTPEVTPVTPDVTPVTPVVSTCDVCFKDIPVDELCVAWNNQSGAKATITIIERTKSYVEVTVSSEGTDYGTFTGTLVPYDPAKDAEYQVIKSVDINGKGHLVIIEYRYRNIQISCNEWLMAGSTHDIFVSTLEAIAP